MGASWFEIRATGNSAREAYNTAVEDAEQESGHDSYNGTISTTHTFDDLTPQFKRSGKTLAEYIDMQMDKLGKRDCAAICIQEPIANKNKTKSQVEHVVTPGTKQWILKYEVENYFEDRVIASCMTKGDAVKMARAYTEKNQHSTKIIMRKVLNKVDPTVAKITYKKSSTEKQGVWRFFGWAAE
jgi:hypothetical protein